MPSTPGPSAAVETVKKAEENVVAIVSQTKGKWREGASKAVGAYLPRGVAEVTGQVKSWWTRERVHRLAETSLPNRHMDALAAEGALGVRFLLDLGADCAYPKPPVVLSRLVCASLTEDRYGVVQRDTPKIIEALLSFLSALEDYQAELNAKYMLPGPDKLKELSIKEVAEKETLAMEAGRASEVLSVVSDGASLAALIVRCPAAGA